MLLLSDLLREISPAQVHGPIPSVAVTGIQEDSRLVQPGNLFVARTGTQTDGLRFIQQAKSRGAIAIVTPTLLSDCGLPQAIVTDPAIAASSACTCVLSATQPCLKSAGHHRHQRQNHDRVSAATRAESLQLELRDDGHCGD